MSIKAKKTSSIKYKMFNIGIFVFITTLIICIVTILLMRNIIEDDLKKDNESMISIINDQIEDTIRIPMRFYENVEMLIDDEVKVDSEIVTRYLSTVRQSYDYFNKIHIISLKGNILNTAPYNDDLIGQSVIHEPFFVQGDVGKTYWTKVYNSRTTGKPTISVTIIKEDYLITADIDLVALPIYLSSDQYFSEVTSISILDKWGTYIVSDNFELVEGRYRFELFNELKMGEEGNLKGVSNKYEVGFQSVEDLNWFIVLNFDYKNSFKALDRFTVVIILVYMILGFILLYSILRLGKKINKSVNYLVTKMKGIINNNYVSANHNEKLEHLEFIVLDRDFTTMADKIQVREEEIIQMNEYLEVQVRERTHELQEMNGQLEEEIQEREKIEVEVQGINKNLDQQVRERTKELEFLNSILEGSVAKAEEANNAKSRFLSVMSHEMRTPLNGIIGFTQMLEMEMMTKNQEEIIGIIKNSSKTLLNLINDILDVAKYESGKMSFEEVEFNLLKVIKQCTKPFDAIIDFKGIKFVSNIESSLDIQVIGDPVKVTQVLSNLLNNALKFTQKGSIELSVMSEVVGDKTMMIVEVKDTGIGIKEDVKQYLFSPFIQANASVTREYGGTGLGLTICKEIVTHYGGSIDVDSVYNEGSIFRFNIPFTVIENSTELNVDEEEQQLSVNKLARRVLVVEDNLVNQKLMDRFLSKFSIVHDIASNGREAVEMAKINEYEIIFMDCQMPVLNGFEATILLREQVGFTGQIIAMTAYATEEDHYKCLECGMDDYLTKPVDLDMLKVLLGVTIKEDESEEEITMDNHNKYIEITAKALMDKIGFDYDTCLDLVLTFVEQVQEGLTDINRFAGNGQLIEIGKKLHQLKGAAGAIRQERLRRYFENAEIAIKKSELGSCMSIISKVEGDALLSCIPSVMH